MTSQKDNHEPLKAVIFADSCSSVHSTSNSSRINLARGLPLTNIPILEWQLSSLARYGVKQAIVLSSTSLPEQYKDPLDRIQVHYLSSSAWTGEGDALRELESRDGLCPVDDFILLRAGTISNINVGKLVQQHKKRRQADRNWLVTCVFRHSTGSTPNGVTIAVDVLSGTLINYTAAEVQTERKNDTLSKVPEEREYDDEYDDDDDDNNNNNDDDDDDDDDDDYNKKKSKDMTIDVLSEHAGLQLGGQVDIHTDVLDVGLDVCSPEFLVEFRENFYYSNVRAYVQEKLDGGDAEVFGNRMFAHFVNSRRGEYASRITCLSTLAKTTSDVVNGWMTPVEPPSHRYSQLRHQYRYNQASQSQPQTAAQSQYQQQQSQQHSQYYQGQQQHDFDYQSQQQRADASPGRGGVNNYMAERVVIGESVSIGAGTSIVESVIGNDVTIGSDVTIMHCIISDGCVIGDRADLKHCILNVDCRVQSDSSIPRNCFLHESACVGREYHPLGAYSFITLQDPNDINFDDIDKKKDSSQKDGVGSAEGVDDQMDESYSQEKESNLQVPQKIHEPETKGQTADEVTSKAEAGSYAETEEGAIHENGLNQSNATNSMDTSNEESQGQITEPVLSDDEKDDDIESGHSDVKVSIDPGEVHGVADMEFTSHGIVIPGVQAETFDYFFHKQEISLVEYISDGEDDLEVKANKVIDENEAGDLNGIREGIHELDLQNEHVQDEEQKQLKEFTKEVLQTIQRAFSQNIDVSNTTTEIKSLKVAFDRSFSETVSRVAASIALAIQSSQHKPDQLYALIELNLKRYQELISNFNEGDLEHHKSVAQGLSDQLREHGTLLNYVFKGMYEIDLLDEDGIVAWGKDEAQRVEKGLVDGKLLNTLRPLLEWMEQEDGDDE